MTCTFFGHRDTPSSVEPMLKAVLTELIKNQNADTFYVGNHGKFDFMVKKLLRELQTENPHIIINIALAYIPEKLSEYKEEMEDMRFAIIPDGIELVPRRFAISYRNKWMIEKSDTVITYVRWNDGGAAQFKSLALRKGKTVIELSESGAAE